MGVIVFEGRAFEARQNETVLDCLLRNGEKINNSCRNGICQSCILKSKARMSVQSQKGLSVAKIESGYFLACQQKIEFEFEVFRADSMTFLTQCKIISQDRISESVLILKVRPEEEYSYRAGQFVNLYRDDMMCRSYSIASVSGEREIEFHIKKVPNGQMSNWLYENDLVGKSITISEAMGECYLTREMQNKHLLLVGIGTGLAPLFGIIKDSIADNLCNKITLFHGGLYRESLYFVDELKAMSKKYENLQYLPVFLEGMEITGFQKGDLVEIVSKFKYEPKNTVAIICGDPVLVKRLKQAIFLTGVSSMNILSDPFVNGRVNK